MSSIRCPKCNLLDWRTAVVCKRCGYEYDPAAAAELKAERADEPAVESPAFAQQPTSYEPGPTIAQPTPSYSPRTETPNGKPKIGLAVFSLIAGIMSVPPFFTIVLLVAAGILGAIFGVPGFIVGGLAALAIMPTALTTGIVALKRANRAPQEFGGRGLAIAGIVCSSLGLIIIPLIAAIAIPNLLAARKAANESAAINSLRTLYSAQMTYQATSGAGSCGEIQQLKDVGLIDEKLASGKKSGYKYELAFDNGKRGCYAYATPESPSTGGRSFLVTSYGVIHGAKKNGARADLQDPKLDTSEVSPVPGGASAFDSRR